MKTLCWAEGNNEMSEEKIGTHHEGVSTIFNSR
jgi:hypothetical protein